MEKPTGFYKSLLDENKHKKGGLKLFNITDALELYSVVGKSHEAALNSL